MDFEALILKDLEVLEREKALAKRMQSDGFASVNDQVNEMEAYSDSSGEEEQSNKGQAEQAHRSLEKTYQLDLDCYMYDQYQQADSFEGDDCDVKSHSDESDQKSKAANFMELS